MKAGAARHFGRPRPAKIRIARSRLHEMLGDPHAAGLAELLDEDDTRNLLLGICDQSSFLWQLMRTNPARLVRILGQPPQQALDGCLDRLRAQASAAATDAAVMEALRWARQETALIIGLADLSSQWLVKEVTQALSMAADVFVACALQYALRMAAKAGNIRLGNPAEPELGSGIVVLALGKHGGRELNYSSDVDLVVFFDPDSPAVPDGIDAAPLFVRLTKTLTRLLNERTGDGYVLRVDLRLRPDPGSTAIAIGLPAAFHYYETLGQNWERAALIKARPIAGELQLGFGFLADLAPFIWRKYFDYAAIADIHAMKRQIHAVRGHAEVTVAGHDVKLGRGGIREVEFFVQTQQLIFGGRRPQLRGARTLDMLMVLKSDGWVTQAAMDDLTVAYTFLRAVEHRLQMVADEQTQRLPLEPEALECFARFCGFTSARRFSQAVLRQLHAVELHYARLFERAPELTLAKGNLVFTGSADDPETLRTLRKMGFRTPAAAAEMVRGWHYGRRAAVQSARAREVLTELVPSLLEAFAGSGDPDAALANFDQALTKMPAAVELFSLLKSNATLRELFGDILGGAPRLAEVVVRNPHLLDAAIDPAMADRAALQMRFDRSLTAAPSTEDFLDRLRDLAREESFAIGIYMFSARIDPANAALAYSSLAEMTVNAALLHVAEAFAQEYGRVPGGRCAVLAMGKLGSREMTATSDLDLILIYDFNHSQPESDGERKLHAITYYARLTQRLVSALTVATRRGRLYEVDLRLRPSGGKGPLASQARGFISYQTGEADTWEHMALTRARFIAGDATLGNALQRAIRSILVKPRDAAALRREVADMRALIAREKGQGPPGDLKLVPGGLLDIEFTAQFLQLRHARRFPGLLSTSTEAVLLKAADLNLASGLMELAAAHRLYSDFTQLQRLTLQAGVNPAKAADGVRRRLAACAHLPDFASLSREILETRTKVRAIFEQVVSSRGDLGASS